MIAALVKEVREILATDRWAFTQALSTDPPMLAAAGLSHCCILAEEIIGAHDRGQEMTGRILTRALFETWAVSYYLQLGGAEAHEAVTRGYAYDRIAQGRSVAQAEQAARHRRRDAMRRNKRIAKANAHKERWNAEHPDEPPKVLTDPLDVPPPVTSEIDPKSWRVNLPDLKPQRLSLMKIIQRLSPLTRKLGPEETYDQAYNYAYRSLSFLGAHASLWVLSCYVDDRGGKAFFRRIAEQAVVPSSFDEPNKYMASLLVAGLAATVFGARDQEAPVAREVLDRFHGRGAGVQSSG